MEHHGIPNNQPAGDDALYAEAIPLVSALLDDVISDRQFQRLAELLDQHASVCDLYVKYSAQQANLEWLHGQVSTADDSYFVQAGRVEEAVTRDRGECWRDAAWNFLIQPMTLSVIVSGLFVTIFLLSMALITVPNWRPGDSPPALERSDFVARVVRTQHAAWSPESEIEPNRVTDLYRGQRIELIAGLAELRFDDGATVLLEAPASLTLTGDGAAQLQRGKLTARVPPRAVGFTIDTAYASIVDLGTEFCVAADDSATDVTVVEGQVNLKLTGDGQTASRVLSAGEGVRVTSAGVGPAAGVQFTRRITPSNDGPLRLVYETFDHPGFAENDPAKWPRGWKTAGRFQTHAIAGRDGKALLLKNDRANGAGPLLRREGFRLGLHQRVRIRFDYKLVRETGNPTLQLRTNDLPDGRLVNLSLGQQQADGLKLGWSHAGMLREAAPEIEFLTNVERDTWYRATLELGPAANRRRPVMLTLETLDEQGQSVRRQDFTDLFLAAPEQTIHAMDWLFNVPTEKAVGEIIIDNVTVERLSATAN